MKEVYLIMSATLGVPLKANEVFTWDYYDKNGNAGTWTGTPVQFYKAFAIDKYSVNEFHGSLIMIDADIISQPADSFSLIHDPRHPYSKLYTVDKLGNLWGARSVLCKMRLGHRVRTSY